MFLTFGLSSLLGISTANSRDFDVDFKDGWRTATENFIRTIPDSLNISIDTVQVDKAEDIIGKNVAFYNHVSKQIVIKHFETSTTNKSSTFQAGIELINLEQLAYITHELRHRHNAEINLFGLDYQQTLDFGFWDEVSARIAELLLRRQAYLETGDLGDAFSGVVFNIANSEDIAYKSNMFKKYIRYLSNRKIKENITVAEVKFLLKIASTGLVESKSDIELYAKTIPILSEHRLHDQIQSHYRPASEIKVATWNSVMSQLFDFDGVNFWQLCGVKIFQKHQKNFQKITRNQNYTDRMMLMDAAYKETLDSFAARSH